METRRLRSALLACAVLATVLALAACGSGQSAPRDDLNPGTGPTADSSQASGSSEAGTQGSEATTGGEQTAAESTTTGEATTGETTEAETTGGETTGGETTGGATGDAAAGKDVFLSAGCVGCHTLADAGATGNVGPNLDELKPDAARVATKVTEGGGGMPSFSGQLSEQQIQDVAAYVAQATGGATGSDPAATTDAQATSSDDATDDHGGDDDNSGPGGGDDDNSGQGGGSDD